MHISTLNLPLLKEVGIMQYPIMVLYQVKNNILQLLQRNESEPHLKPQSLPKHSSTVTHIKEGTKDILNQIHTCKKLLMELKHGMYTASKSPPGFN